jgi:hypothetical protein
MPSLTEQLRRYGDAIEQLALSDSLRDAPALTDDQNQRGPRRWPILAATTAIAAAVVVGALINHQRPNSDTRASTGPNREPTPSSAPASDPNASVKPSGWAHIADLPIAAPSGNLITPVGNAIVVIGISATWVIHDDGSFVTAEAPPEAALACCGDNRALSAGNNVLLVDTSTTGTTEAWLFDAVKLSWRRGDDRPTSGLVLGSALLDGRVVLVTSASRAAPAISDVAALDLTSGSWTELPPLPRPINVGGVTSTAAAVIVAGTYQGPNNEIIGKSEPVVFEYTTSGGWREHGTIPISGQAATITALPDGRLLAFNYDLQAAVSNTDGSWDRLDSVPMRRGECYPSATPVAAGIVGLCQGIAWFDIATQRWQGIKSPTGTDSPPGTESVVLALTHSLVALRSDGSTTELLRFALPPAR